MNKNWVHIIDHTADAQFSRCTALLQFIYCAPMKQVQTDLQNSYNCVAEKYAKQFSNELDRKPFDRKILNWFVEKVEGSGTTCDLGCSYGHIANYLHDRGLVFAESICRLGCLTGAKVKSNYSLSTR